MSDTPETDDLARGNHVVPTEWAEQLERERDEAREKFDIEATEHMLAVNKLCGERDQARAQAKKLEGAYEDATNYYARWSELIQERDEARFLLKQAQSALDA